MGIGQCDARRCEDVDCGTSRTCSTVIYMYTIRLDTVRMMMAIVTDNARNLRRSMAGEILFCNGAL